MNKTVLITGATDGIGKELAKLSAQKGYNIVLHGRSEKRISELKSYLSEENKNIDIQYIIADFSNLKQTALAFKKYKKAHGMPDVLVNNAGVLNPDKKITSDGFEESFQVNHLAAFLLTNILTEDCKFDSEHRIINVSSMIHANDLDFENLNAEKYYSAAGVYAMTKLCNILFTNKLSRIFTDTGLLTASVHPGVINTKLLRQQWGGGAPASEGAANVFFAVEFEGLASIPAAYIENRRPMQAAEIAYSEEVQDKFWELSKKMTENC